MIKETIASFECRGVEIKEVVMKDQFSVKVKDSPTVFHEADFSDLWTDYDEVLDGLATVKQQNFASARGNEK